MPETLKSVCDDGFSSTDAESACYTLGYSGGSYATSSGYGWSTTDVNGDPDIPIYMDDVNCDSSTQKFLKCSNLGWGEHNCGHSEDVLLTCT